MNPFNSSNVIAMQKQTNKKRNAQKDDTEQLMDYGPFLK